MEEPPKRLFARKDYPPDVAADVVAKDDDGIIPEDGGIPLPGGHKVHHVGDGVVEAAKDKERHTK
jgi:hypothetical protein